VAANVRRHSTPAGNAFVPFSPGTCSAEHYIAVHPFQACCLPRADPSVCPQTQKCDKRIYEGILPLTPNLTEFRTSPLTSLSVENGLPFLLSCAPLLCRVEIDGLWCRLEGVNASQTLQALRSLPQSITWQPLELCMSDAQAQSVMQEVCAALRGTPLAQAVSKLTLGRWHVEPPIAALRALFPNVLHFQLCFCPQGIAVSLNEAVVAWPLLSSISFWSHDPPTLEDEQHLEAAARTAAGRKAGPFEIVLRLYNFAVNFDTLEEITASIQSAGEGLVNVSWWSLVDV